MNEKEKDALLAELARNSDAFKRRVMAQVKEDKAYDTGLIVILTIGGLCFACALANALLGPVIALLTAIG